MKVTLHFQQSVKYAKNVLNMNMFLKCIYVHVYMCVYTHTYYPTLVASNCITNRSD